MNDFDCEKALIDAEERSYASLSRFQRFFVKKEWPESLRHAFRVGYMTAEVMGRELEIRQMELRVADNEEHIKNMQELIAAGKKE